jgi:hypothetical protein
MKRVSACQQNLDETFAWFVWQMCILWCCCAGLQELQIHSAYAHNPSVEVLACLTGLTNLAELAVHREGLSAIDTAPWELCCLKKVRRTFVIR